MIGVVFDASTLILLAKIGLLRRVLSSAQCAWIGEYAAREVLAKSSDDARAIAALMEEGLIEKRVVTEETDALTRNFRLDVGEAEAIVLARAAKLPCATDDGPAIRCCKVLGVPFVTALGFLVGLVQTGELGTELGLELLSKLDRFGRYRARILEDAAHRIREAAKAGE